MTSGDDSEIRFGQVIRLDHRCTFMGTVLDRFPILSGNIIRFFIKSPSSFVVTTFQYSCVAVSLVTFCYYFIMVLLRFYCAP